MSCEDCEESPREEREGSEGEARAQFRKRKRREQCTKQHSCLLPSLITH